MNWSFTTLLIIKITSWERSLTFGRDERQLLIPSVSVRVIGDEKQSTPTLCHVVLNSFLLSIKQCHLVCPPVILRSCVLWIEYSLFYQATIYFLYVTGFYCSFCHRNAPWASSSGSSSKTFCNMNGILLFQFQQSSFTESGNDTVKLVRLGIESLQILRILCNQMSSIAFWLT